MIRYLCGYAEVALTGASLESCLNRWTEAGVTFWALRRQDAFRAVCRLRESELDRAGEAARRAQTELRVLLYAGLPALLRRLARRPVLALGVPLAVGLTMLLQCFVWFCRVEGAQDLPDRVVLEALETEGVRFGAWGPGLEPELLKHRMLNRLPQLRWLAVNRQGGVVTVLVAERTAETPQADTRGVTNVIAARPGVVRSLSVTEGLAAVQPGEAVEEGALLISGVAEWTAHVQLMHAAGTVYADTLRPIDAVLPDTGLKKVYTGRQETCISVIFQRKRRKISGNSSIFGTMCDRMTETEVLTLPQGWVLPVRVEKQTLLQYELVPADVSADEALTALRRETERLLAAELVAGQLQSSRTCLTRETGRYHYTGSCNCLEVISKTVAAGPYREEAENGEADQRREN